MAGIGSTAMMTAMMSANTALMQAQTQSSMRASMSGRAGVLESEIKTDSGRGDEEGAARKQEELDGIQQSIQDTTKSQMGALSRANEAMKEAAEKDKETEKAEKDSAGKNRLDQVELSQAGEKKAEKEQKTVAELPDAAAYAAFAPLKVEICNATLFHVMSPEWLSCRNCYCHLQGKK